MDTPKKPAPPAEDIDIMRYLSLFASNWLWIVIALFIALCSAYLVNKYTPRVYNVKSTLLIDESSSKNSLASIEKLMPSGDYLSGGVKLGNEVIILKSHSLNYRVMEDIPDFHIAYVPVSSYGFAGERMYKSSPFIVKKLSDDQPYGVKMEIHFTGDNRFTVDIEPDDIGQLKEKKRKHNSVPAGGYDRNRVYRIGDVFNHLGFNFTIEPRDSSDIKIKPDSRYQVWFESSDDLADRYRNGLSVKVENDDASVFILSFNGYAPQQAADYLNKLMELYGRQGLEWKNRVAESSIMFIDDQLGLISDSLNRVENTMERFRLNNRFVDLTLEGSLILQKIEDIEREKNTAGLQLQYYQYLLQYIDSHDESGSIVSPSVMGISDAVFVGLVNRYAELQQKMNMANYNIKEDLPQIQNIEEEIKSARSALHGNVLSTINQLNMTLADANKRIAKVENDLERLPGTEREMIGIQRKFDLNNTVYTFLLERRAEAGIARASQLSDNRIIDMASSRNCVRVSPNISRNYLVAIILGLIIPMVIIIIIDMLNNKVIDRHDIEAMTRVPIIGYINHSDAFDGIHVVEKPGSTLAESFRSIRTSLNFYTGQTECPVIVISSTVSGEGKTFVSVNLAAIIAMMEKRVLLVSLDLRKPRAHMMFNGGVGHDRGMSSYLSNNAGYDDIIQPTGVDNLWFANAGTPPPNPSELIGGARMKEFIARARSSFDTIIIDTPPVGLVTDALLLSEYANVNFFIVRQRYSIKSSLRLIDELSRRGEMKNMALVVNDISSSGYYGHGLRYSYSMGYGNTYYDPGHYTLRHKDKEAGYYTND